MTEGTSGLFSIVTDSAMTGTAVRLPVALAVRGRRRRFVERYDLAGYVNCAPCEETAQEDAAVCAEAVCPDCGHGGLRYSPWCMWDDPHDEQPAAYRAFGVCPVCRYVEEF